LRTDWPQRRIAAGALFFDESGRLLVLKPNYREGWLTPGGLVEANETPRQGCSREIREELGVDFELGRLLAVDHVSAINGRPEGLMFQFYGCVLSNDDIARIVLQSGELSEMEFVARDVALGRLVPRLGARIAASFRALDEGLTLYLEHGQEPV
jgi:8-oxo-dGTP diphosphatase